MTTSIPGSNFVSPGRVTGRGDPLFDDEPSTIPQLFLRAAKLELPDALNFRASSGWQHISSAEMADTIRNAANGLLALGVNAGDRAAILASNSPGWTIADAACQFAGVVDVPIYTTLAPSAIEYILTDSDARLIFVGDRELYQAFRELSSPAVEKVIFLDQRVTDPDIDSMSIEELCTLGAAYASEHPEELERRTASITADDVATLIYTSGTTGEPKGVMLRHSNIISNVIDCGERYNFSPGDICLSVLPLSHIFERSAMYLYILHGIRVHYAGSIEKVPEYLLEVRPTILVGVPRIFEKVYAKAKVKAADAGGIRNTIFEWAIEAGTAFAAAVGKGRKPGPLLSIKHAIAQRLVFTKIREFFGGRLRMCITGGAALSDDIWLIFTGAGIPIMQGYGLTETSPVITSNNPSVQRLGTVGKPIRNVRVRIAADGEIETTGPGVMFGYYNKPDATREAFTDDGWFRTGDIGEIDDDGFLRITDRKKELFKTSGGKYIAPSPIEQLIRSSRFVSQVVLVGNERKFPAALIVPNFEMLRSYAKHKGLDLKTASEFCSSPLILDLIERQVAGLSAGLGHYEKVKGIALLENDLSVEGGELTPTLKVKRRVINEKYRDVIDRIYADAESRKPAEMNAGLGT